MQKRHFERIAEIIKRAPLSNRARSDLISHFVTELANDNPKFDAARFINACQPGP